MFLFLSARGKARALLHLTKLELCWKLIYFLLKILLSFVDKSSTFVENFSWFSFCWKFFSFCWKLFYLCLKIFLPLLKLPPIMPPLIINYHFLSLFLLFPSFYPHIWILTHFTTLCTPCMYSILIQILFKYGTTRTLIIQTLFL